MRSLFAILLLLAGFSGSVAAADPDGVAVIIGNRSYTGRVPKVDYAHRDADAFLSYVIEFLGYRPENVIDLRDAGQAQMFAVFGNNQDHRGRLWSLVRPGRSDVVVYYSGHGVPGQRDQRGYLLPVDADAETPEINGVALDMVYDNLAKLEARRVMVFIDACFSGDSQAGMLIHSASPVHLRARPATIPSKLVVLTAAQSDQLASWDTEARQGLFTRHLLNALNGAADRQPWGDGDGAISLNEAKAYLDDEMSYAARRLYRREQVASASGNPKAVLTAALVGNAPAIAAPPPQRVVQPAPQPAPAPAPNTGNAELMFWESVRDSSIAADLEAYLARYPNGAFAPLAHNRLAALRRGAPAAQSVPQAAPQPQIARLPPSNDGQWATADGNTTLEVTGNSGRFAFFYNGTTWYTTLTIQPDGKVTDGFVMFDALTGVQFRGTLPNIKYEVFGRGFDLGTVKLQRRSGS